MFNDIVLFLFVPILLLGCLWKLFGLLIGEDDSNRQMSVMLGGVLGAVFMLILAILMSQVFDIRYLSFDPFAFLLPRAVLVGGVIFLCAIFALLILYYVESLVQQGQAQFASAILGADFIFLIYVGYFNLFLETLAAFVIFGVMIGVILMVLLRRFIHEEV